VWRALAQAPADDAPLRKRLWLRIAQHVVGGAAAADGGGGGQGEGAEGAVAAVLALLAEPGAALRLEEVLPLFPAFTRIDHFQPAVCAALAASSEQMEALHAQMTTAARSAEHLRADIAALSQVREAPGRPGVAGAVVEG